MAMLATLHSYVAGPATLVGSRSRCTGFSSRSSMPRRLPGAMRVCCQAETKKKKKQKQRQPQPTQSPPPKPKESTNFSDVLAFSGPAPERINGRLAMLGFVSALAVEVARGDDLLVQLTNGGLLWFLGTAALFSAASLVPLSKGVSAQAKSSGLMTADAELWNGRFAMVGLVALAFTEYLKGGPLV